MRTATLQLFETLMEASRKLGPYVLLELALPGGTLFALALFFYRHPARFAEGVARLRNATSRALARIRSAFPARASIGGQVQ